MNLTEAERAFVAGDVQALCAALFGLCATDLERVEELATFALCEDMACPDLGGDAQPFVASIAELKQLTRARARSESLPCFPAVRVIDEDFDFLGEPNDHSGWTAAQWLNLVILGRMTPHKRAAVVGTMRDDGIYVLEWVAHYLSLGFERLFIYTNDNADGSEHLLRHLAALDVITLIESKTSGTVRPGIKAFNHAVHLLHDLRDYEWILFVDSDEYFVLNPIYGGAVGGVLDGLARQYPDCSAGAVVYQWLWFNSAMVFERHPGLLMERFQYATPHWLTKSLVRLKDVLSMRQLHFPELKPDRLIVDSAFNPLDPQKAWTAWPTQYSGGRINHYWPKSFEEFSVKKARGDTLTLAENEYARDYKLFFEWNGLATVETHHPVEAVFLAKVRRKISEIRALDDVAMLEAEAEQGFRRLVARHDQTGGLRSLYEALKP